MREVVILSAVRTPIGAFQGGLATLPAHGLGARAIAAAVERSGVTPGAVEQVNMGCVLSAGQGQAPARQASRGAGLPDAAGAMTLNKVCGSGMRSLMIAANDLRCGDYSVVVAGGMESMSQAPYLAVGARQGLRMGDATLRDSMIYDGLWDPYSDQHMGNCAELCARKYQISRQEQDAFAVESYERARQAIESCEMTSETVPVEVPQRRGAAVELTRDEGPFRVDLSRMDKLRPAFESDGSVTAANASSLSDGAAALVLTTSEHASSLGIKPIAKVLAHASVAQQPEWFTTAPILAIREVLKRAELTIEEIDLFEINEAFAVVVLACMKELGLERDRVNCRGGAVALGHPIGASGARILVTLLHALAARGLRRGCSAICIGGGEATAVVVEMV